MKLKMQTDDLLKDYKILTRDIVEIKQRIIKLSDKLVCIENLIRHDGYATKFKTLEEYRQMLLNYLEG